MKKYLLLASVAGCLLNVGNAWTMVPGDDFDNETLSTTMNISVRFDSAIAGQLSDMDFGTLILKSGVEANDQLATFNSGVLTVNDAKVLYNGNESPAQLMLSSGCSAVTGITFSPSSVELEDEATGNVAAVVSNLAYSSDDYCSAGYINATLKAAGSIEGIGQAATGTTTVTLEF